MTLVCGLMSFFAMGLGTVLPLMTPMGVELVQGTAITPVSMIVALFMGLMITGISPFSSGGATFIANVPDLKLRDTLVKPLLASTFLGIAIAVVMSALGFPKLF